MSPEPCIHQRSYQDGISSFVAATKAGVLTAHALAANVATLACVVTVLDQYDRDGLDVPTCIIRKVLQEAS